jgi:16S rRNA U1498 N3-methylase RsmE
MLAGKGFNTTSNAIDEMRVGALALNSNSAMQKYNEDALTNWNDNVLEACPNCGRTFLPDRLVIHLKSCKK